MRTAAAQQDLQAEFDETTQAVSAPADPGQPVEVAPYEPGEGIAEMTIPRLGEEWKWIVVEGVDTEDIAKGPGHFPGTAAPGQLGNFAVAGHRATNGEPFAHLDEVVPGDHVVVRTAAGWSVYTVTLTQIVPPTQTDVVLPVPGPAERRRQPGADHAGHLPPTLGLQRAAGRHRDPDREPHRRPGPARPRGGSDLMYAALWRVLPGPAWTRVLLLLAAFVALTLVLFLYVFPAIEPMLPFDQITLEGQ